MKTYNAIVFNNESLLRRKKIKYIFLKQDSFLTKLPAELIIYMLDIKKIVSDVSPIPFFAKIIFKKIECRVFYSYSFKNPNFKFTFVT